VSTYKKINKNFFKKWTPEMAYVLGFFSADGYITVNKRGGQFWCIDIADKKLIEQIKIVINAEHKISVRKRKDGKYTSYRLQIGSIEMCDDLRKLGINVRKSKSLSVPNVPSKFFRCFLRGYFDGDGNVWSGYVHKERKTKLLVLRVIFTSCSENFLNSLMHKLEEFKIIKGVITKSKGNYYRLTYSIHNALKLYDFMYNELEASSILLKRKRVVFQKYIKMRL